jgi:hypothetical protein
MVIVIASSIVDSSIVDSSIVDSSIVDSSIVDSSPDRVKTTTMKLVFVASPLSKQH